MTVLLLFSEKSPINCSLGCKCVVVDHSSTNAGAGMKSLLCKSTYLYMNVVQDKSVHGTHTHTCIHTSLSVLWTLWSAVTIKSFSRNSLLYYTPPHSWHSVSNKQTVCFLSFSLSAFASPPCPSQLSLFFILFIGVTSASSKIRANSALYRRRGLPVIDWGQAQHGS